MSTRIIAVRNADEIDHVRALVWEFFDFLRGRYPEMLDMIDTYIQEQDVEGELENFDAYFLPPNGHCFLALMAEEPVGIVMMKPRGENDAELNRMYVRAAARGKGLGRRLGDALLAEARAQGIETVWLSALYRHAEALALYESLGFIRVAIPDAPDGQDERVIHMKLTL